VSVYVAGQLWALLVKADSEPSAPGKWGVRLTLFACQLLAILMTVPLFRELLSWLTAQGCIKTWS